MIQPGSSALQPSAKMCPSLCVKLISYTHTMRDEGICHHLHYSTEMETEPVMDQGFVMSCGQFSDGKREFSFFCCEQNTSFQFVRKNKLLKKPLLLHLKDRISTFNMDTKKVKCYQCNIPTEFVCTPLAFTRVVSFSVMNTDSWTLTSLE